MFLANNKKLKRFFQAIAIMAVFFTINIAAFSEKSEFLAIGNLKIVRQEPLVIKREDLNITIMFWLDTNIERNGKEDFSNKNTNNRGKFLKNVKFLTDYKKAQNLRAVIKFDENIYENQASDDIQREWFAISKSIPSMKEGKVAVYYDLVNTKFSRNKDFVYSFELVDNFFNKNKAEILYVNVYNKSDLKIDKINFKDYEFKNVSKDHSKEHYELLEGGVNLDGKIAIKFK